MIPVYPYLIRRSEAGHGGEMLLSLNDRKSAMVLQLTMDQARMLAVEMRGLATDHCSLHHMVLAVIKTFGADVFGVLIKGVDYGQVTGAIRIEDQGRQIDVNVDVAAALALALHLGLPIYMDSLPMLREDLLEPVAAKDSGHEEVTVPEAFRDVIESLVLPSSLEDDQQQIEGGF